MQFVLPFWTARTSYQTSRTREGDKFSTLAHTCKIALSACAIRAGFETPRIRHAFGVRWHSKSSVSEFPRRQDYERNVRKMGFNSDLAHDLRPLFLLGISSRARESLACPHRCPPSPGAAFGRCRDCWLPHTHGRAGSHSEPRPGLTSNDRDRPAREEWVRTVDR